MSEKNSGPDFRKNVDRQDSAMKRVSAFIVALAALVTAITGLTAPFPYIPAWGPLLLGSVLVFLAYLCWPRRRSRLLDPDALRLDLDNPNHLKGRDGDIARLAAAVRENKLCFLVGESGTGKSALIRSGLCPELMRTRELLPIYHDLWGKDWIDGPRRALCDFVFHALSDDERKKLALHKRPDPDRIIGVLSSIDKELGRTPILIFDQFDDYQTLHRKKFITGKYRSFRKTKSLLKANSFWAEIHELLESDKLHCLFVTRSDAKPGLKSVELVDADSTETLPLDRPKKSIVETLLNELTKRQGEMSGVVSDPEHGWDDLMLRLERDLGQDEFVLPVQLRFALDGLGDLPNRELTVRNYERAGGRAGLEALHVQRHISSAARALPGKRLSERDVRATLLAFVDHEANTPKTISRSLAELQTLKVSSSLSIDSLRDVATYLAKKELLRKRIDPDTKEEVYQLDHDYLGMAVLEAERMAEQWTKFAKEQRRQFKESGRSLLKRWKSLLTPWQQLRLLIERLRGRFCYGETRGFALWSTMRFLPYLGLLVATLATSLEIHRGYRAAALVEQLLSAEPNKVVPIIESMSAYQRWVVPRLEHRLNANESNDEEGRERLYLHLALLRWTGAHHEDVFRRMLVCDADEFAPIRHFLKKHDKDITSALWNICENNREAKDEQYLRASCALASFDSTSDRWLRIRRRVVGRLIRAKQENLSIWQSELMPVRVALAPALVQACHDSALTEDERTCATKNLVVFAGSLPKFLVSAIQDSSIEQFRVLMPSLRRQEEAASDYATQAWDVADSDGASSQRLVNLAIALAQLGKHEPALSLFNSRDPTTRTRIMHSLRPLQLPVSAVNSCLELAQDPRPQAAIIIGLGEYSIEEADSSMRSALIAKLTRLYKQTAHSGVRSAAFWTLKKWGISVQDSHSPTSLKQDSRNWYTTCCGQTMITVNGRNFQMGSDKYELGRNQDELLHSRKLDYAFAISATEVTIEQYRAFKMENSHLSTVDFSRIRKYAPNDECPVVAVTWFEAVAYCNWLSKREGIPPAQWCYETNTAGKYEEGMICKTNVELTGYRLPYEAEWEFACRCENDDPWHFGETREFLEKYAWHYDNASDHCWPVASLKPNEYGLFDMHGNVWNWCHELYKSYEERNSSDEERVVKTARRVLRGGSFGTGHWLTRSANRNDDAPSARSFLIGFRVARSIRQRE